MTLGVDLLINKGWHGIEVYGVNLTKSMVKQHPEDCYILFVNPNIVQKVRQSLSFPETKKFQIIVNPFQSEFGAIFYQQVILPFKVFSKRIDVLYSPSLFFSWLAWTKKLVTIHDAAYAQFGGYRNLFSKGYILISIKLAKVFGLPILTTSEFSSRDIIKYYDVKPEKITVVPDGTPDLPSIDSLQYERLLSQNDLQTKQYFFFIGNGHGRKNISRIITAFKIFSEKNHGYKLVFAGSCTNTLANDNSSIRLLPSVDDSEKVFLIQNARALLFPSLYEGFGLPILEAQSLSTVVITSNIGVMPDTAGAGAFLVDPYKEVDIAAGMERIITDHDLATKLVEAGKLNISRFSWSSSAEKLFEVFRN